MSEFDIVIRGYQPTVEEFNKSYIRVQGGIEEWEWAIKEYEKVAQILKDYDAEHAITTRHNYYDWQKTLVVRYKGWQIFFQLYDTNDDFEGSNIEYECAEYCEIQYMHEVLDEVEIQDEFGAFMCDSIEQHNEEYMGLAYTLQEFFDFVDIMGSPEVTGVFTDGTFRKLK